MKKPRHSLTLPLLAALGLALTPAPARANMILPAVVFIFSWLHLLIGNLIIGVAEGWLIGRIFKVKYSVAIPVMIAANYFSGWAGYCVVEHWRGDYNRALIDHFDHVRAMLWGAWVALFAGTLALEWPFCFLIFMGAERRWRKSLLALLYSQAASYAVLLALYLMFSDMSLVTETKYERSLDFVKDKKAWVYYLSPGGDAIWRRRLDGSAPQKMEETGLNEPRADLRIYPGINDNRKDWDSQTTASRENQLFIHEIQWSQDGLIICHHRYDAEHKQWSMEKPVRTLSLQTPMAVWHFWHCTNLDGEQAVFEMGYDLKNTLIAVLDSHTLQLAVIARGSSPTVAYE